MRYLAIITCLVVTACATPPPAQLSAHAAPLPAVNPLFEQVSALEHGATTTSVPSPGYRQSSRHGVVVYCRREIPTGTLFSREVCFTERELEARQATTKAVLEELRYQVLPGTTFR